MTRKVACPLGRPGEGSSCELAAGALILADAALARALVWDHLLPLPAAGLTWGDLRKGGEGLFPLRVEP